MATNRGQKKLLVNMTTSPAVLLKCKLDWIFGTERPNGTQQEQEPAFIYRAESSPQGGRVLLHPLFKTAHHHRWLFNHYFSPKHWDVCVVDFVLLFQKLWENLYFLVERRTWPSCLFGLFTHFWALVAPFPIIHYATEQNERWTLSNCRWRLIFFRFRTPRLGKKIK